MGPSRSASVPERTRAGLSLAAGACIAVAASLWAYADVLSIWFTGVDTFPHILSARVDSLRDLPGLLGRQYLAAYPVDEVAGSVGVRPLGNLLFALDHALWGLDASGFQRTALALHAVNAALVCWLCRSLAFRRWWAVGVLASVLFAIHPVQSAVIPLVPGRYDLLLGTFSLVFLLGLARSLEAGESRAFAVAVAALVLALGSNERGAVLWLVAAATLAVRYRGADRPDRARMIRLFGWVSVVMVAYAVFRWWFVEGVGGYPLTGTSGAMALPLVGRAFFQDVVLPMPLSFEATGASAAAYAAGTVVLVALSVVVWSAASRAPDRRQRAPAAVEEERPAVSLEPLGLVAAWCLVVLLFYALAFGLTGILKSNYFYVPSALWCVLLAGGAVQIIGRFADEVRAARGTVPNATLTAAGVAMAACLAAPVLLGVGRQAQLDRWKSGGEVARRSLSAMQAALAEVPREAAVLLANLPLGVTCTDPPCYGSVYVLDDYSVDAWFRLAAPRERREFTALSAIWVDSLPMGDAVSEARFDAEGNGLVIRTSGVRVVAPWTPASGATVSHELEVVASGATLRVFPTAPSGSGVFLYDLLQPDRVLALDGPDGGPTRAD